MLRIGANQKLVYKLLQHQKYTVIKGMMLMFHFLSELRASCYVADISPVPVRQSGFSLIELLISILIFSVGMLGLASLQITSMRMTQDAQQTYLASLLANGIASQLRVGSNGVDTNFWQQQVSETLPSGVALIEPQAQGHRVIISWNMSQDQAEVQGIETSQYVLDVAR